MKVSDFDFFLPPDRIAAYPLAQRDASSLLVMRRTEIDVSISIFNRICDFLPSRSLLVVNETRVVPARLRGRKVTGAQVELFLLGRIPQATTMTTTSEPRAGAEDWNALARGLGRSEAGVQIELPQGLRAEVISRGDRGAVRVRLWDPQGQSVAAAIERVGEIPLPPYVLAAREGMKGLPSRNPHGLVDDRQRYQTVYASTPGAVAAPTAGLHFTDELLARLRADGHQIVPVTLHVGPGTFRPVTVEDTADHVMETEAYSIPEATAEGIETARSRGRAIVAVGTTVVRTLEAAVRAGAGVVRPGAARTDLFLEPGADFQVVTDLITNFHLPRSTLLMLVAAFAGRERVLAAYDRAIREQFRFYSYGDAMFIRGTP